MLSSILLAIFTTVAQAHFRIPFPGERDAENWSTQLEAPCGGDNSVVLPRYKWNTKGSPIDLNIHHSKSVASIYFCPGDNCQTDADFSTLVYEPWQMESAANFCIPALTLPSDYNKAGQVGTLQVIFAGTTSTEGDYEYMYNCVDIVVDDDGPVYDGSQCTNTTGSDAYFEKDIDEEAKNTRFDSMSTFTILDGLYSATEKSGSSSVTSSSSIASSSGFENSTSTLSNSTTSTTSNGVSYITVTTTSCSDNKCSNVLYTTTTVCNAKSSASPDQTTDANQGTTVTTVKCSTGECAKTASDSTASPAPSVSQISTGAGYQIEPFAGLVGLVATIFSFLLI